MGDRRGDHVAAPRVLDGHRDPVSDAEVAGLPGPGDAPELADLDVHHVHRVVRDRPLQGGEVVDRFVQHEGLGGPATDRAA